MNKKNLPPIAPKPRRPGRKLAIAAALLAAWALSLRQGLGLLGPSGALPAS